MSLEKSFEARENDLVRRETDHSMESIFGSLDLRVFGIIEELVAVVLRQEDRELQNEIPDDRRIREGESFSLSDRKEDDFVIVLPGSHSLKSFKYVICEVSTLF